MAGGSLAANALFGDSKMTQVAREAYVRAPICSARPNGIPNGRIVLFVRNVGWYSYYPLPGGRSVAAESGKSLVVVEYEIANPGDRPSAARVADRFRGQSPEHVAEATLRALERGKNEICLSLSGWLLVTVNRFFPRLVNWVAARRA